MAMCMRLASLMGTVSGARIVSVRTSNSLP